MLRICPAIPDGVDRPQTFMWGSTDPSGRACRQTVGIIFTVEGETAGDWALIAEAVEAGSAIQAVAHAARREGRYRVRSPAEPHQAPHHFWVPAWGPPEPLVE